MTRCFAFVRSLLLVGSALAATAGAVPTDAVAADFLTFSPVRAAPGTTVKVFRGGTSPAFDYANAERPLQPAWTIYLVRNSIAASVSVGDGRLIRVAALRPDRNGHGFATFTVPDIEPGLYAGAVECGGCSGSGFWTVPGSGDEEPEFRGRLTLTVLPSGDRPRSWLLGATVVALARIVQ